MTISLKAISSSGIPVIAKQADRIWRKHYTPIIGTEQVEYMLANMYSEKSLSEQIEEGQQFFLTYADDELLGYISVSTKDGEEYFLHKFYLETEKQGKGFGKKFFAELMKQIPSMKTMRLQVNRMNYKSVNFYFRLGFVIEEAKDFDIGDGYFMEDYVMVLKK